MISKSSEISTLQDGSYLDNVISISSSCQACQYWLDSMWFMSTGVVNGLDYFGNKIIFLIKGKAVSLQCNFYCMVSWCFLRDAPQKAVSSLDTYRNHRNLRNSLHIIFVPYICFSFMVYVQGVIYLCLETFLKIDLHVLWPLMRMFFLLNVGPGCTSHCKWGQCKVSTQNWILLNIRMLCTIFHLYKKCKI